MKKIKIGINAAIRRSITHGEDIMVGSTKYCGRNPGYQIINNSLAESQGITKENLRYVKGIPYVNVDKLAKRIEASQKHLIS